MADNSGGILHPCLRSIFSKAIQKNKKGEIKLHENHAFSLRQHALKRESKDRPRPQHVLYYPPPLPPLRVCRGTPGTAARSREGAGDRARGWSETTARKTKAASA